MHRGGSSRCRQKFTSLVRQIHRTAPCWNKPRLIVQCTKVCPQKSAVRPNFFGRANNQRLSSRAQSRDPAAKLKPNFIGVPSTALGMTALKIRKAIESDVPQLLPLMRELAEFEDYADAFAIYRGHSTRTGVPAIAARLLLSGCGRKRNSNWAACVLLRRLHLSRKTKHCSERALRYRRPSQQGRGTTLDESRRPRG